MARWLVSTLAAAFVPALFWLGGFDFNERGFGAMMCAVHTVAAWLFVFSFPGWKE